MCARPDGSEFSGDSLLKCEKAALGSLKKNKGKIARFAIPDQFEEFGLLPLSQLHTLLHFVEHAVGLVYGAVF